MFSQKRKPPKVYSDIKGMVSAEAWARSKELHLNKLKKYREQKDYQLFIEEDEEDIEGQLIYSSIKNLQEEKFYKHYFFADINRDATVWKAELQQIEDLQLDQSIKVEEARGNENQYMGDTFGVSRGGSNYRR